MEKVFIKGKPKPTTKPPEWWKFGKVLWCLLGNSDKPEPPSWYRGSRLHWLVRNPFHNFTWYIIGFEHKDRIGYGKRPLDILFEGFNWAVYKIYWWLWVPFISYQKSFKKKVFQFYIGWRVGSRFGIKCRFTRKGGR